MVDNGEPNGARMAAQAWSIPPARNADPNQEALASRTCSPGKRLRIAVVSVGGQLQWLDATRQVGCDDQDMSWAQMHGDHFRRNRQECGESFVSMVS